MRVPFITKLGVPNYDINWFLNGHHWFIRTLVESYQLVPPFGFHAHGPVLERTMDDVAGLKKKYGARLSFWGGIDTQHILPYGTPSDVDRGVQEMVSKLNVDGGYVLTSVHNLQNDVPPQNITAMFETALGHRLAHLDEPSRIGKNFILGKK